MKGSMLTTGNMELQHLSLSCTLSLHSFFVILLDFGMPETQVCVSLSIVNRLTNETLKKLISCLYYQNYLLLNDLSRGLLHVSLEVTSFRVFSARRILDSTRLHSSIAIRAAESRRTRTG